MRGSVIKTIMVLFFILLNSNLYSASATINNIQAASDSKINILLFGDSIVAGYNLNLEDNLTSKLNQYFITKKLSITALNGGVSGDTTSLGAARLEWFVKKYNPNIVFIALGGNDVLRGVNPDLTKKNLDFMLAYLEKNKIKAILSKVQAPSNLGPEYASKFNRIYTDLAKQYKVPSYPFLLEKTYGKTEYMQSDGIHPNANGVDFIAKDLAVFLAGYN